MRVLITGLLVILYISSFGQFGTLKLTNEAYEGFTLFHPNGSTDTYLINNRGELVHQWPGTYNPGIGVYLLENGQLLRSGRLNDDYPFGGGVGGVLQLVEWDGTVSWEYVLSNAEEKLHHDYQYLPNGNILAYAWEVKTVEEAIEAGRDPATLEEDGIWPEKVIELRPVGTNEAEIVWEWHVWDHLIQDFDETKMNFGDPAENPGKIDINYDSDTKADWLHANAMSYNEELDQIMLSIPEFDEVWVIDHSTTTEEAASNRGGNADLGGEIIYRWGNPQAYGQGTVDDKRLYYQHSPRWLKQDGQWKILTFNNGRSRPSGFISSVDIVAMPWDGNFSYELEESGRYAPNEAEWVYMDDVPTDLYSAFVSSAQLLPNGNMLICSGVQGDVFELNTQLERVWEYRIPIGADGTIFCWDDEESGSGFNFRVEKFGLDYPGLGELVNNGKLQGEDCPVILDTPSPTSEINVRYRQAALEIQSNANIGLIYIIDLFGRMRRKLTDLSGTGNPFITISTKDLESGVYVLVMVDMDGTVHRKKYLLE